MSDQWALLTKVFTGLDADIVRASLETEGIPVLVRGFGLGIFGGAYQGPINDGVEILVPAIALERARELWPNSDE